MFEINAIVTHSVYNDLREGGRQWTVVVEPLGGANGRLYVYSPTEIASGTNVTVQIHAEGE